jgi:hypothetical protein
MVPHRSRIKPWIGRIPWIAALVALLATPAGAQQLAPCSSLPCTAVHTVAASDQGAPLEYTFTIGTPGTYQLTLTDLGAQAPFNAPLAYVKLAITSGSMIVGTPLTAAGSTQFSAQAGTYLIHVTGKPGPDLGSGPIGIEIQSTSGGAPVAQFSGILALPPMPLPSNESVLSDSFTVETAGNYQIALTDLQLPQALSTLLLVIIEPGTATPVVTLGGAPGSYTQTVALASGTYDIFAVGQAGSSNSGLLSATVTASGGATPLYSKVVPIGATTLIGNATLSAGNYTLKIADLQFPGALAQLGALVTLEGQAVAAPLTGAGEQTFTAVAATYQVFATATAGSGGGSYTVDLTSSSGASLIDAAQAVSAPSGSVLGYSFATSLQSGGTYTLDLADFDLPTAFTTLQAAAVQGGALSGSGLNAAGTASISVASGPLSLLVFATPNANSSPSAGLFGIDIATGADTSPAFQATQAVGQPFASQQVSITTPGNYSVTASDIGFPETLESLAVVVTEGANLIGKIYTSGTFNFSATPGDYVLTVLAQPQPATQAEPDEAGTYATSVSSVPSPPTVTLTSNVTQVQSGGTVLLQWSSDDATSCTASSSPASGFSGTVATSGQKTSSALTESTTFTLTCTGAGGTSDPKSITVTVTPGKSGGGAVSPLLLAILAGFALARARRTRARIW